jgi:hypothetical protein
MQDATRQSQDHFFGHELRVPLLSAVGKSNRVAAVLNVVQFYRAPHRLYATIFIITSNQRKNRRTKFCPLRKTISKGLPFPTGLRFWGEGDPKQAGFFWGAMYSMVSNCVATLRLPCRMQRKGRSSKGERPSFLAFFQRLLHPAFRLRSVTTTAPQNRFVSLRFE